MKQTILFLLLSFLVSSSGFTQSEDSLLYFELQLSRIQRSSDSAMKQLEAYRLAQAGRQRHIESASDYGGFALVSGIMHSDYKQFNKQITQEGFEPLNAISPLFGIGMSIHSDGSVFDLYFISGKGASESKKGDEKITATVFNAFQMDYGFNLVKSRILKLYPFVGVSYRQATLRYSKPEQTNPGFTSIANLMVNNNSVTMISSRAGWQGGVGFDILLKSNNYQNIILFIKPGINKPLWKDKYKYKDISYDPKIKHGDWQVSFGIKFGNK